MSEWEHECVIVCMLAFWTMNSIINEVRTIALKWMSDCEWNKQQISTWKCWLQHFKQLFHLFEKLEMRISVFVTIVRLCATCGLWLFIISDDYVNKMRSQFLFVFNLSIQNNELRKGSHVSLCWHYYSRAHNANTALCNTGNSHEQITRSVFWSDLKQRRAHSSCSNWLCMLV